MTVPLVAFSSSGQSVYVYTNCFEWDQVQIRNLRTWIGKLFGDGSSEDNVVVIGQHHSAVPAFMYGVSRYIRMAESDPVEGERTSPEFFGAELADDCVTMFRLRGIVLDYTPASLIRA